MQVLQKEPVFRTSRRIVIVKEYLLDKGRWNVACSFLSTYDSGILIQTSISGTVTICLHHH